MLALEQLADRLKHRLEDFDQAGMGYWRVTALLADGRVFTNVYITDTFTLGFPEKTPFHVSDIIDISWGNHSDAGSSGVPEIFVSAVPVSPWADIAVLPSPDGRKRATFFGGIEIAMGGPTVGTITINAGGTAWQFDSVNPSMVWSQDSRYLAIPFWKAHMQRLLILDTDTQTTGIGTTEYRLLQLERFERGIVSGIDSPMHAPAAVEITVGP